MKSISKKDFSVLVVENEPDAFFLVKKSLEESPHSSSQVDYALNIREALIKLRRKNYHLLIVESDLNEEPGLRLLEEMRRYRLDLPFVLMASSRDEDLIKDAARQGVDDLLIKSESPVQDLLKRLKKTCENHKPLIAGRGKKRRRTVFLKRNFLSRTKKILRRIFPNSNSNPRFRMR